MVKKTIRGKRITIDLDLDKTIPLKQAKQKIEQELQKCIHLLETYPIDAPFNKGHPHGGPIQIKKSSSGNGRHVIAWSDRGLYKHELLLLRKISGDDIHRIFLDSKSHRQQGVLFDKKTRVVKKHE